MRPLVEGLVEPREGGIVLAETGMDKCYTIGCNELPSCEPFQIGEYLPGLVGTARNARDKSSRRNRNGPLGKAFFDPPKFGECSLEAA